MTQDEENEKYGLDSRDPNYTDDLWYYRKVEARRVLAERTKAKG